MQYDEFYEKPDDALRDRRSREYRDLFIVPFFPRDKNSRVLDFRLRIWIILECLSR